MNVLIVEDEMMAQANLARALTQHFPDVRIVGTTGSVRETVLWLRTPGNSADVIFMDVELSDGDCFEIFRQADVTARVIMTTAYDNYAVRAFEVNSIDYLLKPIDLAALRDVLEGVRIDGDLQSTNNRDAQRFADNTIGGNLQCTGNQPAPTGEATESATPLRNQFRNVAPGMPSWSPISASAPRGRCARWWWSARRAGCRSGRRPLRVASRAVRTP